MSENEVRFPKVAGPQRRFFVGGSDARIIMGSDEAALVRLWREKRGEAEPEDLSGNLIVQIGAATEELNRSWYERNTGRQVRDLPMDPLYLTVLVSAEKKFWRCVQSGEVPHLIMMEPPKPRIEAVRMVDMSSSNSWAELATFFRSNRNAFLQQERATG